MPFPTAKQEQGKPYVREDAAAMERHATGQDRGVYSVVQTEGDEVGLPCPVNVRPVVVIPTYNNVRTLSDVIAGASATGLPLIVVNDGSTDSTGTLLKNVAGNVKVMQFVVNRGKGAALRAAFDYAVQQGFTHSITIDSDGQHLASDISLFIEKINEDPTALWIGDRLIPVEGSATQPSGSRFGRRFGSFWYRFHTGLSIRDTQCGFRAYPLETVVATGCTRDRFEYEIEVLILAAWRGIPVRSLPIHLLYQQGSERVSHFRPIRDFIRISMVNSRAAITRIFFPKKYLDAPGLSLREKFVALIKNELRANTSPARASFSLAIGVTMAIMPIHGFQVITLMALSFLLRLNRPLAFVGVSVSSAPLIPFWIAAGIAMGNAIMPGEVAESLAVLIESRLPAGIINWVASLPVQGLFTGVVRWFFGSIVLSLICGCATFFISYPLVRTARRTLTRRKS